MIEPNGVVPFVLGGLGNQLFNVCAAYVVHHTNNIPLYILKNSLENNPHNTHKLDYTQTIFKEFGQHIDVEQSNTQFTNFLLQLGYRMWHAHECIIFQHWDPRNVPPGSILSHYYQNYKVLAPFERDIRRLILDGMKELCAQVSAQYGPNTNSAFLHVRRGDYVGKSHIHYLQPISYYEHCTRQLLTKKPNLDTLWIISDDIPWIKSEPFFQSIPNAKIWMSTNELETFALMSLCKEGAICANSTFSWWGAFLGAYAHRNPIYVPQRWIRDNENPVDLIPQEWTIVPPTVYS